MPISLLEINVDVKDNVRYNKLAVVYNNYIWKSKKMLRCTRVNFQTSLEQMFALPRGFYYILNSRRRRALVHFPDTLCVDVRLQEKINCFFPDFHFFLKLLTSYHDLRHIYLQ